MRLLGQFDIDWSGGVARALQAEHDLSRPQSGRQYRVHLLKAVRIRSRDVGGGKIHAVQQHQNLFLVAAVGNPARPE